MINKYLQENTFIQDCPVRQVFDRIGDKWSILIISVLGETGTMRFNQINSFIGSISQKMLTVTLKSLEADGLVNRKVYAQVPPKVEYSLTPLGESLLPAINTLTDWALKNITAVLAARADFENHKNSKVGLDI